jgi:FSR family fosmidomycin resistance protein-like MFS transporter
METIPLLLIFLGHVWVDVSQGILPVALVKLKELFALNYFQLGLMMTVLNITSSVIQPVFGYISDRVRTGWFIPVGVTWTALCMGLLGWSPSFLVALLLVGIAGFGTAAFHPRAMMAVSLVSGSRQGFGAAIFSAGGNLGFALGPVVGGFLILGLGFHTTMGLLLPGALLTLIIFFYPGDFLKREVSENSGSQTVSIDEPCPIPWVSLISVCLIVTLRAWVYMSFLTYLPLFLQTRGIDPKAGSLMLAVFLAGGAVAGLYGGHLSDQIGRRIVIAVSLLLFPLFMSLMIVSNGPWLWLLASASGALLVASFSVTVVVTQELLPRHLGLASGLSLGLAFGMGGIGTAFTGYLADVVGLNMTVWILAFVPIVGALLVALIKETRAPTADAIS